MQNAIRFKAGFIHFCLSLSLFSIVFFVLFSFWYPEPFFTTEGGWQGLKIVASIDVVLGPLLTLVVFNPSKSARLLGLDMGVIVTLQATALVWGIYTVYQHRPVAVVFWDDSFMTIAAKDLTQQNYPLENLRQFGDMAPPLIYAAKPVAISEYKQLLSTLNEKGIPPHHQTSLYQPLANNFSKISREQLNIDQVMQAKPKLQPQLDALLQKSHHAIHDLQYYLLKAKYQNIILVFTPTGGLVGHLTLP